jgi:import inner membrane translocase subunit TIM44
VGEIIGEASRPIQDIAEKVRPHIPDIRDTEVARQVGKTVDSIEQKASKSPDFFRYGGVNSKTSRSEIESELQESVKKRILENSEAGTSIVHAPQKTSFWSRFREVNPASKLLSYIKRAADRSDNFLVHFGREILTSFTERVTSVFSESETASVIRAIKLKKPDFELEEFLKLLRSYIVPEILEGFVSGDLASLRKWCSEGAYRVLEATLNPSRTSGHIFKGKVLDIRDVDMIAAKMIEDRPILVMSLTAQQLFCVKDINGNVVEGSEDSPENVQYIMAFTVDDADKNPSEWSLVEIAIRDRNNTW